MCWRMLLALMLLSAFSAGAQEHPSVDGLPQAQVLTPGVEVYGLLELEVEINATFDNPYDPDEVALDAVFTSPSGNAVSVPGFYFHDFAYTNVVLTPTGEASWRVRFTPTEAGEWVYQVTVATPAVRVSSEAAIVEVRPSEHRGFVRVDERNSRYFAFDDGTPYFPIGENMAWSLDDPIADYTTWLNALSANGGNFIRVWTATWGFSIEWNDTGLGNYDNRQDRAYQLDRVIELAAERDVYIMLTLMNHGQFNEETNPEWADNPYNSANGGPCPDPACFATSEAAQRHWHNRLRYIAARWGYSPNIMAWEWWNEVNWTPLVDPDLLTPWMARSDAVLRTNDPTGRMITHSGSTVGTASVWNQTAFTQAHLYNMGNLPLTFRSVIPDWLDAYPDKPFLMGEFGSPSDYDLGGVMLHNGLWAAPMNGAAGTGMTWWWDTYIHPNNLYHHFAGIAAFFEDEDMAAHIWEPAATDFTERTDARAYGLQTSGAALLWVVNRDYNAATLTSLYQDNIRAGADSPEDVTFPTVSGAVLVWEAAEAGQVYNVESWDTLSGLMETQEVTADETGLTVALPDFETDLALKIRAVN